MTSSVLFLHSVPGSGFDPDPETTASSGLRLLAPDRPGYGETPPLAAGVVPSLGAVAELHAASLDDPVDLVVGWSGGGHHALALAALHPQLVRRVALVATPAPDDAVPWIPDEVRAATEAMRSTPSSALAMAQDAMAGVQPDPGLVTAGPSDERRLEADPALAARLDDMLRRALAHGPSGMAADIVAQHVSPWGFDLAGVRQPVALVYGDADPLVSVEHGLWFAGELPNATLDVVEEAGHLVLVDAWRQLLAGPA